ncbi:MAG: trehalase family glycosidase [Blastocatellia bacterium]
MKSLFIRASAALLICLAASIGCDGAGFYRVEQRGGVWWFIAPDGKPFFSNGVNVVTTGAVRENYHEGNPEYAAFRHYATTADWVDATLSRLRAWNFNTIGGWSSDEFVKRTAMPYTVVLHLGGSKYVPWGDLFDEGAERAFDEAARLKIGSLKDDPNLLGYFTDNELGWWDDTIFFHFLDQPSDNATRSVLLGLLRSHYNNDFARLRRDFDTNQAQNFNALECRAGLTLKPGGQGARVIDKFIFLLAERYYQLARNAIRRCDSNHLILGDRFQGWYPQAVARAAKPYVDVISTNYGADWTDGRFSEFYLDTLHRLTGKPILVTEYYMCAMENRSGNRNSSAGFPVVRTQRERAASFRTNLTALAELPYVVGAHWFQYFDEPERGRSDGEDYNMGLVDINDRPYEELTTEAAALRTDAIHKDSANVIRKTRDFVLVPEATGKPEDGLTGWSRQQSLIEPGTKLAFADLYACWDKDNLYLGVYAADFAEPRLYARSVIPDSERMTWTITLGAGKRPLEIRFGPGGEPVITGASVTFNEWQNSTRFTLIVKLPATLLGKAQLRAGVHLQLRSTLASHSRAEFMEWNQPLRLGRSNIESAPTANLQKNDNSKSQGLYFSKKVYTEKPLPKYDRLINQLPAPVYDEDPTLIRMYWKAWELASTHFYEPTPQNGFVSQYIDAAFNKNIFLWDTCFMTMFTNYAHPLVPGIGSLDNFYAKQHKDGEICREISRATGIDDYWVNEEAKPLFSRWGWNFEQKELPSDAGQPVTYKGRVAPRSPSKVTLDALNHPIPAWAEIESYRMTGDRRRLSMVWEPLVRYYGALQKYLLQGNGLYITDWASMDNSPRNPYLKGGGTAVDISCEMVLFARDLAEMGDLIDRKVEAAKFRREAEQLARLINRLMWNDKAKFYFDLTLDGQQIEIKTVAAFWALISGVASKEQARALVAQLNNPATFARLHRVPTLAADEKKYDPAGGHWRGSIWAPINTMILVGLERYGYHEEARAIALNHLNNMAKVYLETGTIWENYAPDAAKQGNAGQPNFVGWSGIGPIMYLIEYGIGLKADAPKNELVWRLEQGKRRGCERLRFNNHVVSLVAEPEPDDSKKVKIRVESDGDFKLRIIHKRGQNDFRVTRGTQVFLVNL